MEKLSPIKVQKSTIILFTILAFTICLFESCEDPVMDLGTSLTDIKYSPTSYNLDLPAEFPPFELPDDNELTTEKVELGQHLFYDPILSADSTMSCSSCHLPEKGFTDGERISFGIDGIAGERSSMSLVNQAFYNTGLFWEGRVETLEEQALLPVEDPIELHNNWNGLMKKLRNHDLYPTLFRKAFGVDYTGEMTKEMAAKALAQFQRVIISGNSKFDRVIRDEDVFTDEELEGFEMFFDRNPDLVDAECAHCHNAPLLTTNEYRNNGLTEVENLSDFPDLGRGLVTGNPLDYGKFRVPSLRNISLTGPYMHDGRFETLEEVIEHYNSGGHFSPNRDPLLYPLGLTEEEKSNLKLFLLTLVDTSYLSNTYIQNPFN